MTESKLLEGMDKFNKDHPFKFTDVGYCIYCSDGGVIPMTKPAIRKKAGLERDIETLGIGLNHQSISETYAIYLGKKEGWTTLSWYNGMLANVYVNWPT